MTVWVANSKGMTEREVEARYSPAQITLLYYIGTKAQFHSQEMLANLIARNLTGGAS